MVIDASLSIIVIGIFSFFVGFLLGFYSRSFLDTSLVNKVDGSYIILVVVSSIWLLSMLVDILSTTYETSTLVHGLMGIIVGFFYKTRNEK